MMFGDIGPADRVHRRHKHLEPVANERNENKKERTKSDKPDGLTDPKGSNDIEKDTEKKDFSKIEDRRNLFKSKNAFEDLSTNESSKSVGSFDYKTNQIKGRIIEKSRGQNNTAADSEPLVIIPTISANEIGTPKSFNIDEKQLPDFCAKFASDVSTEANVQNKPQNSNNSIYSALLNNGDSTKEEQQQYKNRLSSILWHMKNKTYTMGTELLFGTPLNAATNKNILSRMSKYVSTPRLSSYGDSSSLRTKSLIIDTKNGFEKNNGSSFNSKGVEDDNFNEQEDDRFSSSEYLYEDGISDIISISSKCSNYSVNPVCVGCENKSATCYRSNTTGECLNEHSCEKYDDVNQVKCSSSPNATVPLENASSGEVSIYGTPKLKIPSMVIAPAFSLENMQSALKNNTDHTLDQLNCDSGDTNLYDNIPTLQNDKNLEVINETLGKKLEFSFSKEDYDRNNQPCQRSHSLAYAETLEPSFSNDCLLFIKEINSTERSNHASVTPSVAEPVIDSILRKNSQYGKYSSDTNQKNNDVQNAVETRNEVDGNEVMEKKPDSEEIKNSKTTYESVKENIVVDNLISGNSADEKTSGIIDNDAVNEGNESDVKNLISLKENVLINDIASIISFNSELEGDSSSTYDSSTYMSDISNLGYPNCINESPPTKNLPRDDSSEDCLKDKLLDKTTDVDCVNLKDFKRYTYLNNFDKILNVNSGNDTAKINECSTEKANNLGFEDAKNRVLGEAENLVSGKLGSLTSVNVEETPVTGNVKILETKKTDECILAKPHKKIDTGTRSASCKNILDDDLKFLVDCTKKNDDSKRSVVQDSSGSSKDDDKSKFLDAQQLIEGQKFIERQRLSVIRNFISIREFFGTQKISEYKNLFNSTNFTESQKPLAQSQSVSKPWETAEVSENVDPSSCPDLEANIKLQERLEAQELATQREHAMPQENAIIQENVKPQEHAIIQERIESQEHAIIQERIESQDHAILIGRVESHDHVIPQERIASYDHAILQERVESHDIATLEERINDPCNHVELQERIESREHIEEEFAVNDKTSDNMSFISATSSSMYTISTDAQSGQQNLYFSNDIAIPLTVDGDDLPIDVICQEAPDDATDITPENDEISIEPCSNAILLSSRDESLQAIHSSALLTTPPIIEIDDKNNSTDTRNTNVLSKEKQEYVDISQLNSSSIESSLSQSVLPHVKSEKSIDLCIGQYLLDTQKLVGRGALQLTRSTDKANLRKSIDEAIDYISNSDNFVKIGGKKNKTMSAFSFITEYSMLVVDNLIVVEREKREKYFKIAIATMKKVAFMNHADAQYHLGNIYVSGVSCPSHNVIMKPNHTKGFNYYVSASKQNHSEALFHLGLCYEEGVGVSKSYARALINYKKAALSNHPGAMFRLGMCLIRGELRQQKQPKEGVKWLRLAVRYSTKRYPHALYQFAMLHEKGYSNVIWVDHAYLVQLLVKAASLNHVESQYLLGETYEYGNYGVEPDPGKSVYYYSLAALNGSREAMHELGGWYLTGAHDPRNNFIIAQSDSQALGWVKLSAIANLPRGMYTLAYFYELGICCDVDIEKSKYWYIAAAKMGEPRAIERIKRGFNAEANIKWANDSNVSFTAIHNSLFSRPASKAYHKLEPKKIQESKSVCYNKPENNVIGDPQVNPEQLLALSKSSIKVMRISNSSDNVNRKSYNKLDNLIDNSSCNANYGKGYDSNIQAIKRKNYNNSGKRHVPRITTVQPTPSPPLTESAVPDFSVNSSSGSTDASSSVSDKNRTSINSAGNSTTLRAIATPISNHHNLVISPKSNEIKINSSCTKEDYKDSNSIMSSESDSFIEKKDIPNINTRTSSKKIFQKWNINKKNKNLAIITSNQGEQPKEKPQTCTTS